MIKKIIKRISLKFFKLLIKILIQTIRLCNIDLVYLLNNICIQIEKNNDIFVNYKIRPKKSNYYIPTKIKTDTQAGELAIVLQGIIETKDDFTFETVQLYKKIFPNSTIIISTWDNTNPTLLKRFENAGCEIVISKSFKPCGYGNVNYQICTSFAGIKRAKEMGAKYVLKNRSDLRIYKEFAFEYLKSLLNLFPVKGNEFQQKGRIITLSGNKGQMFIPYWLQDFLYFGLTEDLFNLFDIPYNNSTISKNAEHLKSLNKTITAKDLYKPEVPELYITTQYLRKYKNIEISIKQSWDILRDYFFIIDFDDLNVLWNKYGLYNLGDYAGDFINNANPNDWHRNIKSSDMINILSERYKYEDWMENESEKYVLFKENLK